MSCYGSHTCMYMYVPAIQEPIRFMYHCFVATPGVLRGTTVVPWGYYGGRHYEHYTMHYKAGYG